jgi:aspartyl/glutamyl-tRNA(Asn/Gln) amidotransferase C subunit
MSKTIFSFILPIRTGGLDKSVFSCKFDSVAGEYMMINLTEVKQTARLAALRLSEPELMKFQRELISILKHFHQLDRLAADIDLAPRADTMPLSALRNDKISDSLAAKVALKNAPSVREGMFNVPKVI